MAQVSTQMLLSKISSQAVQIAQLELMRDALLDENAKLLQALEAKVDEPQPEVASEAAPA